MQKIVFFFGALVFILSSTNSYGYVPEPQSEGKYFSGKGTKASEEYEANAGTPTYDYGKGIQWGPLHLTPSADYKYRWTDNVFYSAQNEKSDYIHQIDAEILGELPFAGGQHLLSASYAMTREIFERFGEQDHTDQRGTIGLKLNFVPFTLDVENTYERTVSRADTEFTERIQRDENAFHSLLEVPFASFFLENEITDFNEAFERDVDEAFNHNLFTVYQRVGYDMSPVTQVLVEYAYININYTEIGDRDGDANQFMFGLRGNFTERIAYQLWGGAQYRIYDEDIRPDFNDFVFRSAIQWQPSEINLITLKADRAPQESTFDNQSFYTRNRILLSWRRQIAERWFVNSYGTVSYNEYSRITVLPLEGIEKTRRDTGWDAGAELEYRMANEIVSFLLGYRFASRDSNIDSLDYDGNEISAGVRARF